MTRLFQKPVPDSTLLQDRLRRIAEGKADAALERPQTTRRRERVYKDATLVVDACVRLTVAIKDLSHTGVRIEFVQHQELPQQVLLIEHTLKLRHQARVVWQRDGAAGLKFED